MSDEEELDLCCPYSQEELLAYAREHDLWCYWAPGWMPCPKDHPGATEDLNTAAMELQLRG